MKKVLLILLAFLPVLMYADECSDAYKAGLSLYKNKKYVEAQSKFIAVVSKCNSYADVLSMLKVCNEKIKEEQAKQTKQIATLEIENRQLRNAANQAKAENTSTTRGEEAVLTINSTRKKLNEDLEVTRKDLQIANDSIVSLNHTIKHLNDSIVSLNKSLQSAHTTIDEQNKKISSLTQPKENTKASSSPKKQDTKQSAAPTQKKGKGTSQSGNANKKEDSKKNTKDKTKSK